MFAKKRFGQNFLIDKNIIRKIATCASLTKDDVVLEIGPGRGILTEELLKQAGKVIAVEVDKKLAQNLKSNLQNPDNLELIQSDILKLNLKDVLEKQGIDKKIKIISNIPYNITTLILEYIFKNICFFDKVYLMVQKEFALRLVAKVNSEHYSSLSCFTQFYSNPKLLFIVKPTCFRPQPKVDSYVISLEMLKTNYWQEKYQLKDQTMLFKVIRQAFNQRRKNILNSLSTLEEKKNISERLEELNINKESRAENLSLQDYVKLSNSLCYVSKGDRSYDR